ncbi:hypothetical protein CAPTEDRAFT_196228, partial [Capitella teleta]
MSSVEDRTWNCVEESGDPESQGAYGSGANGRERLADEQVLLDEDPAIPEQSANDDKKSEGGRSVRTASSRLSSASARRERAAIRMKKVKEDAAIKLRMLEEKEKMLMLENEQLAAIEEEMVEDEFEDGSSQSGIRSPLSEVNFNFSLQRQTPHEEDPAKRTMTPANHSNTHVKTSPPSSDSIQRLVEGTMEHAFNRIADRLNDRKVHHASADLPKQQLNSFDGKPANFTRFMRNFEAT